MREYRQQLAQGQTSPFHCGDYAVEKINQLYEQLARPLNILDVGSGSGQMMKYIVDQVGQYKIKRIVGLDWSPTAVERLRQLEFYNQIHLCQSSQLPTADREFDLAISIENLEHLYSNHVIMAIEEMARVAEHIVIVTPTPKTVINHDWLGREITEAAFDQDQIDDVDYQVLEGAVHKSVVLPDSMMQSGFEVGPDDHGRYFAKSQAINTKSIIVYGIDPVDEFTDLSDRYRRLLAASLGLGTNL